MDRDRLVITAVALGILLSITRRALFPDWDWWNLIMAGLLLIVLALWLWRAHQHRDEQ